MFVRMEPLTALAVPMALVKHVRIIKKARDTISAWRFLSQRYIGDSRSNSISLTVGASTISPV